MYDNIIAEFYEAFENLDADRMILCYHDDIVFEDAAFGKLEGEKARNMWKMLCSNLENRPFTLNYYNIQVDEYSGSAVWEAEYIFTRTGRKVHNKIRAEFQFHEGKILRHIDHFDLYKWARQALGFTGLLIGWTPWFKRRLNKQTQNLLSKFERTRGMS